MKTILAVMVKDGAAHLERCLNSVESLVDDAVVLDTGSTDDTVEVAEAWGAHVRESEWKGWSESRNELLDLVRSHDGFDVRALLLDADMTVEGELPEGDIDCWNAMLEHDGMVYRKPFLVSMDKPWEWRGVTHEALCCDEPYSSQDTDLFTVVHHGASGGRLEDDRELLEAGPVSPRNLFYLAQTYRDLGDVHAAIAIYEARAKLGGYDEERFYSLYQAGCLLCAHVSFAQGAPLLLEAWKMRPHRAEPLRALATSAMNVADKIPFPDDHLFIEPDAYLTDHQPTGTELVVADSDRTLGLDVEQE
jgi:hypothetical protein